LTMIDTQYSQAHELFRYLTENSEISMLTYIEPVLKKNFLLQCASYHENEIMEILRTFAKNKSSDQKLAKFVRNFMIERQYERLFIWQQSNVNKFFSYFGAEFKDECKEDVDRNEVLSGGINCFIQIAESKNNLIHNNLVNFSFEMTIDEIYNCHNKAMIFIQYLKNKLLTETDE